MIGFPEDGPFAAISERIILLLNLRKTRLRRALLAFKEAFIFFFAADLLALDAFGGASASAAYLQTSRRLALSSLFTVALPVGPDAAKIFVPQRISKDVP
ncbi:MAG: hypothetical protein CL920_03425 [Deltaproteobacteria bacterium]|nr:hypothetical protein [Deltaproteobacteria bacterium]